MHQRNLKLLPIWYLSGNLTHIHIFCHLILSFPHHHPLSDSPRIDVCCFMRLGFGIMHMFSHPVAYMERMCTLHSKDDWAELNSPVLSYVQSNQLKSSWLRWTHSAVIYTGKVDTAVQLSCTDAVVEHIVAHVWKRFKLPEKSFDEL